MSAPLSSNSETPDHAVTTPCSDDDEAGEIEALLNLSYDAKSENRRLNAAFVLVCLWGLTVFLHVWHWGAWLVLGVALFYGYQLLRVICAQPQAPGSWLSPS
ncbi:MAG: hypothetical protein AAGF24_14305, partial [Cyanobacteria bacterium P01_H01_bin.121]